MKTGNEMTAEEVGELIRLQVGDCPAETNAHGINIKQALVPPQRILLIARTDRDGRVEDQKLGVWLVGRENLADGYKIIMREDGLQFGLASSGFATDKHPILVGWYGSLNSAFLGM
jgi:hypothetical protein